MNKEWVANKRENYDKELENMKEEALAEVLESEDIPRDIRIKMVAELMKIFINGGYMSFWQVFIRDDVDYETLEKLLDLKHKMYEKLLTISDMSRFKSCYDGSRFLDSDKYEFNGDIVITDPCYFTKDDWDYGENEGNAYVVSGSTFSPYMERDTIYGDWSCTVFNESTKEKMATFAADGGMVAVAHLDDILRYNPEFRDMLNNWCVAIIKNFKGTVQFVVDEIKYEYDGKQSVDYEVRVVGDGVDKVTGEKIQFRSTQTGL